MTPRDATTHDHDPGAVGLVDWHRTARRVRASVLVLGSAAVVAWVAAGLAGDGVRLADLGGWIGVAVGLLFLVEVVVVGGAALRGMLRAGERGERLASDGVGLLPPRVPRPSEHPALRPPTATATDPAAPAAGDDGR